MASKACPRLTFRRDSASGGGMAGLSITALQGKREVGVIIVRVFDRAPYVSWIEVDPTARRCGISTKLYEQAARDVCSKYGTPLAVDHERTAATEAFWQKQVKKGRARCVAPSSGLVDRKPPRPEEAVEGRGGCFYYQLKSCKITDLSGRKRLPIRRK